MRSFDPSPWGKGRRFYKPTPFQHRRMLRVASLLCSHLHPLQNQAPGQPNGSACGVCVDEIRSRW